MRRHAKRNVRYLRNRFNKQQFILQTKGKTMKTVEVGNNVKVHYVGTLTDGTEFDSSHKRGEALLVEVGSPGLLKAFDEAIVGMTEGEIKEITLSAEEGYGARNPEAFQTVPKEAFGSEFQFEEGQTVQGNGPYGPFLATIKQLEETEVVLDMNHPLAGEALKFQIEMLEIIPEGE
jgi:peptidylprolyl isomerase